jgi:hypothetical protein
MEKSLPSQPVKLIAAILFKEDRVLDESLNLLADQFGNTDYQSQRFEFDVTDYYCQEMGSPLYRIMVSFQDLIDPGALPDIKQASVEIEKRLLDLKGGRTVKIDTGYLDFDKVVLASLKRGPYKIYMSGNIWADMTLHYEKGDFHSFAWSFADFKDGRYNTDLLKIREKYKKALKI